jgi:hypothetical protein
MGEIHPHYNTAMSHFATGVGPLISGSIIGEVYPGGPLTNYWLVGIVAGTFGVIAIGLSLSLRTSELPAAAVPIAA